MSKMDGLRAMREARYAENAARARTGTPKTPAATAPAEKKPAVRKPAATKSAAPATGDVAETEDALCGHRNMSGRTCTREQGHAAKSHRYS